MATLGESGLSAVTLFIAINLWLVAVLTFDHNGLMSITDLGLAPLLPLAFYGALAALLVGFALLLRRQKPNVILVLGHYLMLIAIWHATPSLLYGTPRYPFTYKHIGISAYIQQYGSIDPNIDAYFNWPGFFTLSAFASDLSGLNTPYVEAIYAPILMNIFIVAGLLVLLHGLTRDPRVIWLSAWVYLVANWVGQDYFAPQSFAYALHLMVLGVFVTYFSGRGWRRVRGFAATPVGTTAVSITETDDGCKKVGADPGTVVATPWERSGLLLFIIVGFAAVVASHQLTPFMTIASIAALIVLGLGKARLTLVLMVGLLLAWLTYMAQTYFAGHLGSLLASVGRLLENMTIASEVLAPTAAGDLSPQRLLVLDLRQWLTLLVGGLAVIGFVRRSRGRSIEWVPLVLMIVPAAMVALQPYGGEIIMRIYLFSVPLLAYFVARAFFPTSTVVPARGVSIALIAATAVMAAGMTFAYYGNESMNYVAEDEIVVLEELYAHAEVGSLIVTQTNNAPTKHSRYDEFSYLTLVDLVGPLDTARDMPSPTGLARAITDVGGPRSYLLLTRSQEANARLFGFLPGVDWVEFRRELESSQSFETVFANAGGAIFRALELDPGGDPHVSEPEEPR